MNLSGLTFGIYPLSAAGTPFGLAVGPEDNYENIQLAFRDLRGESKKLLPRNYLIYTKEWESKMLSNADRYLETGLIGDLTIGCGDWTHNQEPEIELDNWLNFIRKVINRFGSHLASLQITNEPNLSFMEGSKPYILKALAEGVVTAKKETLERNLQIKIGFGSVPESPAVVPHFWENLSQEVWDMKINRIDHVSVNVNDLSAAKAFFLDLGLEVQGEWEMEGDWLGQVVGL